MSVNTSGKTPFTNNNNANSIQQQQQHQDTIQNSGLPPQFGIASRLASFGSGGEMYEKLFEKFQTIVKTINTEMKNKEVYNVIKLLKQRAGLNYSAIVVTETLEKVTSAHILMIERTGDYPEKLIENLNGIRYEIARMPADGMDEKYVLQAKLAVSEALNVPVESVAITDGTLVPNEFDINNEILISSLMNNTFNAVFTENAIRVSGYQGFNLQKMMADYPNGKFFINMYFNNDETNNTDQTGMPIRQSVCIAMSFKTGGSNNNSKSIHQGSDSIEIVKTYGYVDFAWNPTMLNGVPMPQKFVPNFIITHIDSPNAPTPDILMLGIASVLSLKEEMNWMQAFRPTIGKKNEIDFDDIGALNIEANLEMSPSGYGAKMLTKDKTFTLSDLNSFVQKTVADKMMVSIDIPKAGPETWYTSIFSFIKFKKLPGAYNRLNNAMQMLTSNIYQPDQTPLFADISNKIHGGFYKTKDGYRDLRHLSTYLGFCNYIAETNQSPALIPQYSNTLYNTNIPSELRAAERRKYLDEMSNKTAVYKQYYDRITFNALPLINWVNALRMAGCAPIFSNMGQVNDMFIRRNSYDFNSAMFGADVRFMGGDNNQNFINPYAQYFRSF